MYYALAHKENIPVETASALKRWMLIKLTGWTDEYIENLPIGKVQQLLDIEDGYKKAMAYINKTGK